MQYVIRVDIGLQSLRTALFSAEGNFAAKALPVSRSVLSLNPPIALRIQTPIADWGRAHF
jgi:hypothetical protein